MKTAAVGDIQKNFSRVLRNITAGEDLIITKRGKPIAKITSLGPKSDIDWPDFYTESVEIKGKSLSKTIIEDREDRF
ncbi:MAG: type II toxin-antitoxin system prevent-host-death family antitoxin [Thermodesulfobacteriota bacterium]|nr:type II toxin-antitoxin system prevent-host-death family antitoxin [Thermodesulfobacteriota bacterium]